MHPGKSQSEHIDEFHKLVGDLVAIDTAISDKDQAFLLLTSLPSSYDNFVETLLYDRDTMKLEDVVATLNSRELQKMTEAKGDGGEWFYVKGRSGQRDVVHGQSHKEEVADSGYGAMGNAVYEGRVRFKYRWGMGQVLCWTTSGTKRANCVYTLDGQAVTRKTLKGGKQLGEYQTGWKIKTGNVLDSCNQRSPSSTIGFKTFIDMLGLFGWLASKKQGMLEPVKVKCIFLGYRKGIVGNKLWRSDDVTSKVVLYRNMGFNESGEYKKTFSIGSGVGTGSMQVLHGFEFKVEQLGSY
ncbi:hypothetical protein Tco_0851201, partial [Tanacetum coccineum]